MAEADLITLLMGRAVRLSMESPESSRWRALRTARSLMALAVAPSAGGRVPRPPRASRAVGQTSSEFYRAAEPPLPAPLRDPPPGPPAACRATPGPEALLGPPGSSSSVSRRSAGRSGASPDPPSPDGGVGGHAPSGCCLLGAPRASSVASGKRGASRRPEQWRRTVSGGLESLSVCDDSDTDSRFRNLGHGPGVTQAGAPLQPRLPPPPTPPPAARALGAPALTSQGSQSPSRGRGPWAPPGRRSGPPSPRSGCASAAGAAAAPPAARAAPCCCAPAGRGRCWGRPTTLPPRQRRAPSAPEPGRPRQAPFPRLHTSCLSEEYSTGLTQPQPWRLLTHEGPE